MLASWIRLFARFMFVTKHCLFSVGTKLESSDNRRNIHINFRIYSECQSRVTEFVATVKEIYKMSEAAAVITDDKDERVLCSQCLQRCKGFLTDREQRKLYGMGVLYLAAFPLLLLMIVVGAVKAAPPGDENPNCPAEPNMPWFLVTGGATLAVLLLIRIALNKLTRYVKNRQDCCDHVRL